MYFWITPSTVQLQLRSARHTNSSTVYRILTCTNSAAKLRRAVSAYCPASARSLSLALAVTGTAHVPALPLLQKHLDKAPKQNKPEENESSLAE